ncbi:FERM domain-containing protein C-like [Onthophagus taurus]|uniref:FERM domain-containing protein C-like n=1 Tax=Onthophagus taurus TaxID=166361 RepID=UPI0039BE455E
MAEGTPAEEDVWEEEEEEEKSDNGGICAEPIETLLEKNTESFQCLGQYIMSRSSLLRNPLYHFPPLEDPGIDAAFYTPVIEVEPDLFGLEKYKSMCKELKIMTLRRVISSLETSTLYLKYYSLSDKQLRAITTALRGNTCVTELNLEENFMKPESVEYVAQMLIENEMLEVLNFRECRIGSEGAEILADGIANALKLTDLDLSCNSLGNEGLEFIKDALCNHLTIKRLNLSKNELTDVAIPALVEILKENAVIEDLDLSWNIINAPRGWKQLANEGLLENKSLRVLNLAWNGITEKPCLKFLLKFTKATETLEKLDISNNMIPEATCKMFKTLIVKNNTLLSINLGFNKILPETAQTLIELLLLPKSRRPKLEELYMDNVYIKKNALGSYNRARRNGKKVTIGGVLGNWVIKGPDVAKLLFERARMMAMAPKKKKMQKDFSHFIFTLPETPMQGNDFIDLVTNFKMKKVDKDLVNGLVDCFKYKKSGIDAGALRQKYIELYPDAQPAPKKEKKKKGKKGKKKGDTETEGETEGGDQGEYYWDEDEEGDAYHLYSEALDEAGKAEQSEVEEGEEEEGDEEEEMEGEIPKPPVEVAHGESVTDVIAQIGDSTENKEGGNAEHHEG